MIEAGGKDAVLVDEDADLEAAADAALWGACSNAGQTCIGVERVYVHDRVYDEFLVPAGRQGARPDAPTTAPTSKIGPITMPSQLDVISAHIEDALDRGGRAVLGGPDAVGERFVQPTILVDVPEDSSAVQEETFGPTVTVTRVRDMDEAVGQGQRHPLRAGLDGVRARRAGWSSPSGSAPGMTAVNGVITFAGDPVAAVRRRRRLGLRPDPRARRAQGVHLRQGDRAAAVQAGCWR